MQPVFIFDLDGTLTDPREGIVRCIRHALEHLQADVIPCDADLEQYIGPPLREGFATMLGDDTRVDSAVSLFRERYGAIGAFENVVYPGMHEALDALHRRATLFVATSKPGEYAVRILDHFDLTRFFRAVYGSELSGERADKTELLAHLLDAELLQPSKDVAMIGDRKHDILAARAHGLRGVGVTWGFGSPEELRDAGADVLCTSVGELARCLLG